MKNRVDFLTSLQAERRFKTRARQVLLFVATLVMCVIGGQTALLGIQAGKLRSEIGDLEAGLQGLKELETTKVLLEKKKEDLSDRRRKLEELLELQSGTARGKRPWSEVLAGLASSLPPGVWFDRLTLSLRDEAQPAREASLHVSGTSFSQEELLDFLSRLEQDPRWQSATLQRADREKKPNSGVPGVYRFEIALKLPF